jgi:polyvinyl alcohol dehydrogenase (cytochrome)
MQKMPIVAIAVLAAGLARGAQPGANRAGEAVYKERCAVCHEAPSDSRIPAARMLRSISPENIVRTLENGLMQAVGARLTADQKRAVAEFLAGRTIGSRPATNVGLCAAPKAAFSLDGPAWNGWSSDLANTRFQPVETGGLTSAETSSLRLKWAFAFPDTFIANGQPSIVGGRIFVASANRNVYSLDARSGCQYWSFEAEAPVRTAISVAALTGGRRVAFFGDQRANAYAGGCLQRRDVVEDPDRRSSARQNRGRSRILRWPVVRTGNGG